jgi:type I restriction-modification system DNA methylase subunit
MSNKPVIKYANLKTLARKLRDDLGGADLILAFAYNRTGKTRLSMEFKDIGKRKNNGQADTLYFNAYTEDLFTWDNDIENDTARGLKINQASRFFDGFKNEPLEPTIDEYLKRYADFDFDFVKGKRQNQLTQEHIAKIIATYQFRKEEPRYSRRVGMDEVTKNDFNLNISRYISTAVGEEEIDLAANYAELKRIEKEIQSATAKHNRFLEELGLPLL